MQRVGLAFGGLPANGQLEEMEPAGSIADRVEEHGHAASQGAQQFVQSLVDRRVEGVTGAYEHGVEVLIEIEMLLVERDLPVRRLGLAESPDGGQTIGPKIGEDVLDPP